MMTLRKKPSGECMKKKTRDCKGCGIPVNTKALIAFCPECAELLDREEYRRAITGRVDVINGGRGWINSSGT